MPKEQPPAYSPLVLNPDTGAAIAGAVATSVFAGAPTAHHAAAFPPAANEKSSENEVSEAEGSDVERTSSDGGGSGLELEERTVMLGITELRVREQRVSEHLAGLEALFERRRAPVVHELAQVRAALAYQEDQFDQLQLRRQTGEQEVPPGPKSLRWVEGDLFSSFCICVILVNALFMFQSMLDTSGPAPWSRALDNAFMVWYVFEIMLKVLLHRHQFLCGPVTLDRVLRWLDALIVVFGAVDLWVLPFILPRGFDESSISPGALRMCRLIRLTRMLRIIKVFVLSASMDLSWTESARFESFMTVVIVANSITMGLELDVQWVGFEWLNVSYLLVYTFEVFAKLQRHRCAFFTGSNAVWNSIDFLICLGGLVELFALPIYSAIVYAAFGQGSHYASSSSGLLSILPIFRLFRVLRLYKLLTRFPALKKLVLGIGAAMQGTIWVIVLAFLVLYMFAIVFTTLIGHGIAVNREDHREAVEAFGSVTLSLYNMFKLMNDDQTVVMFTDSVWVKIMFMVAMVVLNWVMLATLTSVVTDQMHSHSTSVEQEDAKRSRKETDRLQEQRLFAIFREMDKDSSGEIDSEEFQSMLGDSVLRSELQDATSLPTRDLVELFDYSSHEHEGRRVLLYEDFISKLKRESLPACERTVFRVEEGLRASEKRMMQRFDNLMSLVQEPVHERCFLKPKLHVPTPAPQVPRWEKKARELDEREAEEARQRDIMLLTEKALSVSAETAKAGSPASGLRGPV